MKEVDEISLRRAYMHTFNTESGMLVLKDLENRCFKRDTTFVNDPIGIASNEGRRQTLLHIENMISNENMSKLVNKPEKGSL